MEEAEVRGARAQRLYTQNLLLATRAQAHSHAQEGKKFSCLAIGGICHRGAPRRGDAKEVSAHPIQFGVDALLWLRVRGLRRRSQEEYVVHEYELKNVAKGLEDDLEALRKEHVRACVYVRVFA